MWPCAAGPAPDWRTLRVQAEVGGQLAAIGEAADVADGGHERRRDDHVDARDGHQPLDLRPGQRLGGDAARSTAAISASRKSTWRSAESTVSRSHDRQLLLGQPAAPLDAEQIRRRRAVLQTAHQRGVDLVLGARARANSCARRASRRRIARIRSSGRPDPDQARPPTAAWPAPGRRGGRSSPAPGGSRCRCGETTITRATCASRIARDRPRVAGHLQRHPVARIEALREQLQLLGPGLDPARRSQPALLDDRDLAEVAMNIQRYCPHLVLLTVDDRAGEPVGKRHRRIRARSATGQVAGAATEKPGLEAHRPNRPAQPAFSQKAPRPSRAEPTPTAGQHRAFRAQFHAPNRSSHRVPGARAHALLLLRACAGPAVERVTARWPTSGGLRWRSVGTCYAECERLEGASGSAAAPGDVTGYAVAGTRSGLGETAGKLRCALEAVDS